MGAIRTTLVKDGEINVLNAERWLQWEVTRETQQELSVQMKRHGFSLWASYQTAQGDGIKLPYKIHIGTRSGDTFLGCQYIIVVSWISDISETFDKELYLCQHTLDFAETWATLQAGEHWIEQTAE